MNDDGEGDDVWVELLPVQLVDAHRAWFLQEHKGGGRSASPTQLLTWSAGRADQAVAMTKQAQEKWSKLTLIREEWQARRPRQPPVAVGFFFFYLRIRGGGADGCRLRLTLTPSASAPWTPSACRV